jgi:hypothetical protein
MHGCDLHVPADRATAGSSAGCQTGLFVPLLTSQAHPCSLLTAAATAAGPAHRSVGENGGGFYYIKDNQLYVYYNGRLIGPTELASLFELLQQQAEGGTVTAKRRRRLLAGGLTINSLATDGRLLVLVLGSG